MKIEEQENLFAQNDFTNKIPTKNWSVDQAGWHIHIKYICMCTHGLA